MSDTAGPGANVPAGQTPTSAPQAQQQSPAPSAYPDKVRVKVEGRELEVPFKQLVDDYQLREASNRRFQQASEMAKKAGPAMEAFEALQNGDIAKAKKLLPPAQFRQAMESYLLEEIEYEQLPEYEQRRIKAEMRAQQLEDELKGERETKTKDQAKREFHQASLQVDNEIGDIIEKMGKKPTPYLVAAIVDEMIASLDGRGEPLNAEKAYRKAQQRLNGGVEAYISDMTDADFIQKLPPQRMEAIRKHLLGQVKSPTSQRPPASRESPAFVREDSKPMSIDEAFAARERQLKQQQRRKA